MRTRIVPGRAHREPAFRGESSLALSKEFFQPVSDLVRMPLLGDLAPAYPKLLAKTGIAEELDKFFAQLDGVLFRRKQRVVVALVPRLMRRDRCQHRRNARRQRLSGRQSESLLPMIRSDEYVARMHQPRHL